MFSNFIKSQLFKIGELIWIDEADVKCKEAEEFGSKKMEMKNCLIKL